MKYTQREVEKAVRVLDIRYMYWGSHRATEAFEREVDEHFPGQRSSPVIDYPYSRMAFFFDSDDTLRGVGYEDTETRPVHVHEDPRNYEDDPAYFMKFPLTAALDEL
jgi:hypothetical protein